jgi:hypothetical protein
MFPLSLRTMCRHLAKHVELHRVVPRFFLLIHKNRHFTTQEIADGEPHPTRPQTRDPRPSLYTRNPESIAVQVVPLSVERKMPPGVGFVLYVLTPPRT